MPKQTPTDSETAANPVLVQVLQRKDIWRGQSQTSIHQGGWGTGHASLDQALLYKGWPVGSLVEICQPQHSHIEWLLLGPMIRQACAKDGYIILLNPPAQPYVPGLVQQGVDLDRIILVGAPRRADFVASLVDILHTSVCQLLLCWEPSQGLSYAELRKCQLAAAEHPGFCALFRHQQRQQQSSPATLRLNAQLNADFVDLRIFKQRGKLGNARIQLPLPATWQALPAHYQLGQSQSASAHPDVRRVNVGNSLPDSML